MHPILFRRERGSALVIAALVVVIMTLLGLAFLLAGETESRIARNQRDSAQAGFVAEGAVRVVKKWFDAPAGHPRVYTVFPTASQVDRSLRWVDDDGDGTYEPYSSASAPFNVTYKQSTGDLFQKPYRGSPEKLLLGPEDHPDIRISESGSQGERDLLRALNESLYSSFPSSTQQARIRQIDVYGPPIISVGGQRTRYGIATVKAVADVYQYAGTANETRIATRIVKAILNEAPYLVAPGGPLQSCVDIQTTGNLTAYWGPVTAVNTLELHSNLDEKAGSSIPLGPFSFDRIIGQDINGDGSTLAGAPGSPTPDDQDGDGTLDFDQWAASVTSSGIDDPWLRFWSNSAVTSGSNPILVDGTTQLCSSTSENCQPSPFFWATRTPRIEAADSDHSNIVMNVRPQDLCPQFEYQFWKDLALSGGDNLYYYQSDGYSAPSTPSNTYKLFGGGPSVTVESIFEGGVDRNGIYFFDTATNSEPVDLNADGSFDNMAGDVELNGRQFQAKGMIYLNANLRTTGSGNLPNSWTLIPPPEPFVDANANGTYDSGEYRIDLRYPTSAEGSYYLETPPITAVGSREDPALDGTPRYAEGINVYGIFFTSGRFEARGNFVFFGRMVTEKGMLLDPPSSGAGNPRFFYDERMNREAWPPDELNLPRTVISAWQTDL